jgi:deoxycytidylate deaminase
MADALKRNVVSLPVVGTQSEFDARREVQSTHTSELVIALCGPIGSQIHSVAETIQTSLVDIFGYDKCEKIRLSEIIREYSEFANIPEREIPPDEYGRIRKLIDLGDVLRQRYGAGILAEIAISKIAFAREKERQETGDNIHRPRRVCHIIDSIKNQEELELLRAVYGDMLYFVGVFSPTHVRQKNLEKRLQEENKPNKTYELIDRDSGEELPHGQTVRDTFPLADFFLRIESETDAQIKTRVDRFLHLILNTKVITPSYAEKAMYAAASAAGNSACLSRQVGAALTDEKGEIISVGWNDVPKFGGDLYAADPVNDPTGEKDKRCWNLEGGTCFNDQYKRITAELVVNDLISGGLLTNAKREDAINRVISNARLRNLIEFSRSIHAEMHALILGCQLGGSRVKDGKLFITTYPCHSCARHIVAAGVKDVYYIEPYRKSLATTLHDDAITESEEQQGKVRILPYDGVAPTKYLKLFKMVPESRKRNGKMPKFDLKKALPRFDKSLEAFPALEAMVVKGLKEKKLIPEDGNA